jgi:hypothetical protein
MMDLWSALVDAFKAVGRLGHAVAITVCDLVIEVAQAAVVTFGQIKSWLSSRGVRANVNPSEVGFTFLQAMENGDFTVVGGFFDLNTNKVTDAMAVQSMHVDPAIQAMHSEKPLALLPANQHQRTAIQNRINGEQH